MRSFSLVLLRRLLFRSPINGRLSLYDHLPTQALSTLERILLYSLLHEPSTAVRRKSVDTITDLANNSMSRGRPWHALQAQTFSMAQGEDVNNREAAFRVFAGSPNLIMDLQTESVLAVLQKGLQDPQSIEVCPKPFPLLNRVRGFWSLKDKRTNIRVHSFGDSRSQSPCHIHVPLVFRSTLPIVGQTTRVATLVVQFRDLQGESMYRCYENALRNPGCIFLCCSDSIGRLVHDAVVVSSDFSHFALGL